MKSISLTFGSFTLIWIYLIVLSSIQIYLGNDRLQYFLVVLVIVIVGGLTFIIVKKFVDFKIDSRRNTGLKKFENIKQDRKIGIDFVAANLFPLMDLELFSTIRFSDFSNKLVIVIILLFVVNYSQNFSFNFYLWVLNYRVYRSEGQDEVLLMKKKDYGSKQDYQQSLNFEEIDNSNVYILKNKEDKK